MLEKLSDIRKSLECGCYHSALALALTLPDICGGIKYPNMQTGLRYKCWYNEYVLPFYGDDSSDEKRNNTMQFDGNYCYKLRCKYLHEGHIDIQNDSNISIDKFTLCLSSTKDNDVYVDAYNTAYDMNSSPNTLKSVSIRLDLRRLCKCLCIAAENFYKQMDDPSIFDDCCVEFVNIEDEIKKISKTWGI